MASPTACSILRRFSLSISFKKLTRPSVIWDPSNFPITSWSQIRTKSWWVQQLSWNKWSLKKTRICWTIHLNLEQSVSILGSSRRSSKNLRSKDSNLSSPSTTSSSSIAISKNHSKSIVRIWFKPKNSCNSAFKSWSWQWNKRKKHSISRQDWLKESRLKFPLFTSLSNRFKLRTRAS